jgi:hypothetical protein
MGTLEFPGLVDFLVAEQGNEGEGTVLLHQLPARQDAREKRRLDGLCRLSLGQTLRETLHLHFEGTLGGYVFRRAHASYRTGGCLPERITPSGQAPPEVTVRTARRTLSKRIAGKQSSCSNAGRWVVARR